MPFSHYPAKVWGSLGVRAVPLLQDVFGCSYKLFLHFLAAQNIVWGNAGLPQVDALPPQDASDSHLHVHRVININWATGRRKMLISTIEVESFVGVRGTVILERESVKLRRILVMQWPD